MKVTYNWLKDFVEIKIPPKALADKLTMAGLEVTSLEERDGDHIFEIEITSNRPDWLSMIGVAREVAAITGKRLKLSRCRRQKVAGRRLQAAGCNLKLAIEDKKDCPLYIGTIITDLKVGPSPEWLKERLESVGCRSVNNIVDITNYVLFETGEPLHAFDLDKLAGNDVMIAVRRAASQEKITTLDGVERTLDPQILVIADAEKPVAVAGVMGGKDTEVTGATKRILLEAAVFNPQVIRRGRRILGAQSEASYRFERGVALAVAQQAAQQAIGLIESLACGRVAVAKKSGVLPEKKRIVRLDIAAVSDFLGEKIAAQKARAILTGLGFKVAGAGEKKLSVEVPAHRQDVTIQRDLAEEIARIYGYDRIPNTLAAIKPEIIIDHRRGFVSLVKDILTGLGLQEVITYSLIAKDALSLTNAQAFGAPVEILNPLSKEQEILRPVLLPGLLNSIAVNLNRRQEYVGIFEIASVFTRQGGALKEELTLSIGLCGSKTLLLKQGAIKDGQEYLHLKGILCALFERLGIREYNFYAGPERALFGINIGAQQIGSLSRVYKAALDRVAIKNKDVFAAEVSLEKIFSLIDLKKKFKPIAAYPAVRRDISIVVNEDVEALDILEEIRRKAGQMLEDAQIIDYYKGKQIAAGKKSLTISCTYRSLERTLTEAEINPVHSLVLSALAERFQAVCRA